MSVPWARVFCVTILGSRRLRARPVIHQHGALMKKLVLILAVACVSCAPQAAADKDVAAWEQQAQNVTIIRDDWGIPHVYGKTDADAVFGVIYAQAEDDFNRVETNYLNSMGRLAEAEGEARDLPRPADEALHRSGRHEGAVRRRARRG